MRPLWWPQWPHSSKQMTFALTPIAALLGAVGRRVCGGLYNSITGQRSPGGDLPVRIFFAVTLALSAYMGGVVWWAALALVPLNWIGTTTGLFDALAMGRGGNSYWKDFLWMTVHGLISSAPPAVLFYFTGGFWAAAVAFSGGLLISPCYSLGWSATGLYGRKGWPKGMQQGTEVAELLWGAVMGVTHFVAAMPLT
jgi:hypothetical protein